MICSGPSLLELLDKLPMVDRKVNAPVMIPISEKYKDMGTIAVGKLESGHIRKGDTLLLMPNKDEIEVAAMYNEIEEEVQVALSGDNVRIRLRGVEDDDISPGFVLTSVNKPVHAVRQFEAQLAILDHKNIICAGYSAVMHVHTLAEEVTLSVRLVFTMGCDRRLISLIGNRHYCTILTRRRAASRGSHLSLLRNLSGSSRC
jgi:peptide chain release factor subunit 3